MDAVSQAFEEQFRRSNKQFDAGSYLAAATTLNSAANALDVQIHERPTNKHVEKWEAQLVRASRLASGVYEQAYEHSGNPVHLVSAAFMARQANDNTPITQPALVKSLANRAGRLIDQAEAELDRVSPELADQTRNALFAYRLRLGSVNVNKTNIHRGLEPGPGVAKYAKEVGYQINCQRVAPAVAARITGEEISAQEHNDSDRSAEATRVLQAYEWAYGAPPATAPLHDITKTLSELGHGATAVITYKRPDNSGHATVLSNDAGRIVRIEGQTNEVFTVRGDNIGDERVEVATFFITNDPRFQVQPEVKTTAGALLDVMGTKQFRTGDNLSVKRLLDRTKAPVSRSIRTSLNSRLASMDIKDPLVKAMVVGGQMQRSIKAGTPAKTTAMHAARNGQGLMNGTAGIAEGEAVVGIRSDGTLHALTRCQGRIVSVDCKTGGTTLGARNFDFHIRNLPTPVAAVARTTLNRSTSRGVA